MNDTDFKGIVKKMDFNFHLLFLLQMGSENYFGTCGTQQQRHSVQRGREDKSGDKQDVSVIWLWDRAGEQDSLFWAGSVLEQPAPNDRPVSNTKVEPGRGGTEPLIRGIKTLLQITTCQTKEWQCTLLLGSHYYYTDLLSFQLFPSADRLPLSMQHCASPT